MVTVFRAHGLRVIIFIDDHQPAHVHVFGNGQAKINLLGLLGADGAPELVWATGMNSSEVRRAMRIVVEQQALLLSRWEDLHGRFDAAQKRGRLAQLNEPRAAAARYDLQLERVVVELTNGCTFTFPPHLAQGLEDATGDQLAQVEILGLGYGLHWEELDADLSIPGLLAGLFGTKAYMAKNAGQTKSPAKAAAARTNGAKGGRPRKAAQGYYASVLNHSDDSQRA